MIPIKFDKLYSVDRKQELCNIAIPLAKGRCLNTESICVCDSNYKYVPTEAKATAYWDDGSIKWLYIEFLADIKANSSPMYYCDLKCKKTLRGKGFVEISNTTVDTGKLRLELSQNDSCLFDNICVYGDKNTMISGVILKDKKGCVYDCKIENWHIAQSNSLKAVFIGEGWNKADGENKFAFKVRLTIQSGASSFELGYTLINTTMEPLEIESLVIEAERTEINSRATVAHSNYKTTYHTNSDNKKECVVIDADYLLAEANEHFAEVFYGTFFGDITDSNGGLSATVYQAQQNFPKAIAVENNKMSISLVPEGVGSVCMQSGTAREQKILFDFHRGDELKDINNRSTIYQMPDRPVIMPQVFKEAGVFSHIIVEKQIEEIELFIMGNSDEHSRAYGMMNWGDSPDMGYTSQGRGKGHLVWTNNEYDFPHACMLAYARTGIRRYIDYVLVTAKHWLDVDICHYSDNPLEVGGQWEHTYMHTGARHLACSHEWVEGLLDYYHLTGDKQIYDAAVGIGNNVMNLLETPMFQQEGEINARETGWALRTLTALYIETNDDKWLSKCEWIVGHFRQWMNKYGLWLAPYTDNTEIRVVFMISIAVGSLMRYYMVCKSDETREDIKRMILISVDDLVENARMNNGLFIYKELPSLARLGNNPCVLEALAIAYELTGNKKYIKAGLPTLKYIMELKAPKINLGKRAVEDAVLIGSNGTKGFAQMMVPFVKFYKAASECDMLGYLDLYNRFD